MRRLLFGSTEDKHCFECGMMIPWSAKKCPFCHSIQNSTLDDIHQYGCLTIPLILLVIWGIIALIVLFVAGGCLTSLDGLFCYCVSKLPFITIDTS